MFPLPAGVGAWKRVVDEKDLQVKASANIRFTPRETLDFGWNGSNAAHFS